MSIWQQWQQWRRHAGQLTQSALNVLLPRRCLLCARACDSQALCADCLADLPHLLPASCPVCAHPHVGESANGLAGSSERVLVCGQCLAHPPAFDATLALYAYAPPVDQLVQSLKYGRRLTSADFLGRQLRDRFLSHLPTLPIDRFLPMPLAPGRLAERGFNQAIELARPLALTLGKPLDLTRVARTRETPPQVNLPWKERAKNIRNAFACSARLDGEHVLVIDDVMTTGATLNELATVLKAHGARRVTNLVVARTMRH